MGLTSLMKKCDEHSNGKTCVQVIAEGHCFKDECSLFKRVLNFLPKLKKMKEAQSRGIILTTVWNFSEKAEKKRLEQQRKAETWLNEFYPRIEKNLAVKR